MTKPVEISFDDLRRLPKESTELWVQPSVRQRVEQVLRFRVSEPKKTTRETKCVIVIGGGTLLDAAKAWRADQSPATRLIAVPSIWGSGAEVSPIVVANDLGQKDIRMDDRFLPDQVVYWPELADDIPGDLARTACGDSWSHALEGFLSPLADDALRNEIAELISRMLNTPLGNSPRWFKLSAEACGAQACSSVGLVHGIAHTLEGPLRTSFPDQRWGHAKLCSSFLAPVMAFNGQGDGKSNRLLAQYGVDKKGVLKIARELHDASAYRTALPFLIDNWRTILRDQCTRTNVRLVRPSDLEFFERWIAE
ncbi:MAG: iron-containing alcohol dehydrogenase [Gammaproteobacteria bacterium]|nr:iron-containing alcohol dehydrogenase [Gammaproteobacteria bacterium]